MADQKTYSIRIDGVTESIKDVGTLGDAISGLGSKANGGAAGLNELGKATQKLNSFNREYQTALQSVKAELAAKNKEVKQAVDYDSALLTIEANIRDSYRDKQNLLSALGTAIKSMNTETDGQKQRQAELIQQYNELNNELKEMDAAMGNHQRNVGNYEAATVGLKQQLADMKAQMADMLANGVSKADPAFVELAKKAGALKDAIGDAGEEINRFASDTKSLDNVISVAESATAAFGLFKGAMSAFGMETEEADKAIQQLAGAMSIIQSLKTLQEQLEKGGAAAKMMNGAMKVLTLGIKGTTTATKALRIALASIGIGIVIALLTTLIANWEKIYGWFQKTFPVLKNLGEKFHALGEAIKTGVIGTLKTLADGLNKLFNKDFSGAWETLKNGFSNTLSDMKDSYSKDFQEQMTIKQAEESNKRTKQQLAMLKAQKGNQAKYSKEGIALQKKEFEERKKMARGNKEELDKIAVEEANFYRECQENKANAAKKAAADAKKAAQEAAEAAKKEAEELKKQVERVANARTELAKTVLDVQISELRIQEELARQEVKRYENGPIEKYREAVEKLNEVLNAINDKEGAKVYQDRAKELADSVESIKLTTSEWIQTFEQFLKIGDDGDKAFATISGLFENVKQETEAQKKQVQADINLVLKAYQQFQVDKNKAALDATKRTKEIIDNEADVEKRALEQRKKEFNDEIELTTLKYEDESDKKSDKAKSLLWTLETAWGNYFEWLKKQYGEDSKEYLEAQKKKKSSDQSTASKGNSGPFGLGWDLDNENEKNLLGMSKKQVEKLADDVSNTMNMAFQGALNPAFDAFSMMLEFAIEEAQEALDEATEMHDKSVEKVQMSQERITELNDKLRNSSGSQLEAYKEQMADEQALLLQREAEEKRLAKEKEKREKELEKKKKQQERLNMAMNLMDAIANTAVGVTSALKWGPIIGPIFAAMIGAMGAVQIALITKQLSKMANGGVLGGKEHKDGGVKIPSLGVEVERGEAVINKRSTAKYLPLLDAINAEGNGGKHTLLQTSGNVIRRYANGGVLNYQKIDDNFNTLNGNKAVQQAIESIDLHPVVEVVQIAKGLNNLSTVREIAGGEKLLK